MAMTADEIERMRQFYTWQALRSIGKGRDYTPAPIKDLVA